MARDRTLRGLRKRSKLTQPQLANAAGLSLRTIVRLEQGSGGNSTTVRAVASALGVSSAAVIDAIAASRAAAESMTNA